MKLIKLGMITLLLTLVSSLSSTGQTFTSLDFSVSPVGTAGYVFGDKDASQKIDRRFNDSYLGARMAFVKRMNHRFVMTTEARYITAKRNFLNIPPREWLAPYAHPTKLSDYALHQFFGFDLLDNEHWHPELSIGLGAEHIRSDAKIHHTTFDLGFKFKVRYNVKRVGFFIGANAMWGIEGESNVYPAIGQHIKAKLNSHALDCEAGVSLLLNSN